MSRSGSFVAAGPPPAAHPLRRVRLLRAAVTRRRRWRLSTRILVSQLGVLLVVAALGLWLNLRLATGQIDQQYQHRSLAVAQSVADMPQVSAALSGTGPRSTVQQIALRITRTTGAAFVVVVDRRGIRLSSPNPAQVGKWFHERSAGPGGGARRHHGGGQSAWRRDRYPRRPSGRCARTRGQLSELSHASRASFSPRHSG